MHHIDIDIDIDRFHRMRFAVQHSASEHTDATRTEALWNQHDGHSDTCYEVTNWRERERERERESQ